MKVRIGFVSNSSSSSFVMVVDKDLYDKVIQDCSKFMKAVAKCMSDGEEEVFGTKVVTFSNYCNMGGETRASYADPDEEPEEGEISQKDEDYYGSNPVYIMWEKLQEMLHEANKEAGGGKIWSHHQET